MLLYAWHQYRDTRAALWWAGAEFMLACGIVLIAIGSGTDTPLIFKAGLTLLCTSSASTWAGARSFDGRSISPALLCLGTLVWLIAHTLPDGVFGPTAASLLHAAITLSYYASAAFDIRSRRGEILKGRFPTVVLLATHALTLLIAVPATLTMTLLPNQPPPVLSWFGIIHFETLVFAIGTAIFLIIMTKERSERRLLEASHTDALTGIANRRGFLLKAEQILDQCRKVGAPVAVVLFDLDRFKLINDTFGHAVGDSVIKMFAGVCERTLRPSDLVGRLGGEEFAAILPGSGVEAGFAMAERIRKVVVEGGAIVDGSPVGLTISGGVAASERSENIHALLKMADIGLYEAKSNGRNRVICVDLQMNNTEAKAKVIRIA